MRALEDPRHAAWRYLVPGPGRRVGVGRALVGAARQQLAASLGEVVPLGAPADGVVLAPGERPPEGHAGWVVALGVGPWGATQRVVPGWRSPRLLVPTHAGSGPLRLYTPSRPVARAAHALATGLGGSGVLGLLGGGLRVRGGPGPRLVPPGHALAVATGTAGAFRKEVLLELDPAGATVAYGQLSADPVVRGVIAGERARLQALRPLGLVSCAVPETVRDARWGAEDGFFQRPPGGDRPPWRGGRGPPVVSVLAALFGRTRVRKPLSDTAFYRELAGWADAALPLLEPGLASRIREELAQLRADFGAGPLWCGLCHGDFIAWNLKGGARSLLLFDWEQSVDEAPPFLDLLPWALFAHHHIRQRRTPVARLRAGAGPPGGAAWAALARAASPRVRAQGAPAPDARRRPTRALGSPWGHSPHVAGGPRPAPVTLGPAQGWPTVTSGRAAAMMAAMDSGNTPVDLPRLVAERLDHVRAGRYQAALGVDPEASDADLEQAFRRLAYLLAARRWERPDLAREIAELADGIAWAYEVLSEQAAARTPAVADALESAEARIAADTTPDAAVPGWDRPVVPPSPADLARMVTPKVGPRHRKRPAADPAPTADPSGQVPGDDAAPGRLPSSGRRSPVPGALVTNTNQGPVVPRPPPAAPREAKRPSRARPWRPETPPPAPPSAAHQTQQKVAAARSWQQQARQAYERRAMDEAEACYRKALALEPANPRLQLELGWTVMHNTHREPEERLAEARPFLEEAVVGQPYDATTRYCMATYWRETGDMRRYRRELKSVLRCEPGHARAQAELDAIGEDEAGGAPESKRGLFGLRRLFGGKGTE